MTPRPSGPSGSMRFYASLVLVCQYLEYRDLAALAKVSPMTRLVVSAALARRINDTIKPWLNPESGFWDVLEKNRGIISGSFVMRLLDATSSTWTPGSLDIYVPDGQRVMELTHFLKRTTKFVSWSWTAWPLEQRPLPAWQSQWREEVIIAGLCEAESPETPYLIRIFPVRSENALDALPYTWSTAHVNFLSLNFLVCAYPRATLHQQAFVIPRRRKGIDTIALTTLADRGYRIRDLLLHASPDGEVRDQQFYYDPHAARSLGDAECLVLPIDRGFLDPTGHSKVSWPCINDLSVVSWVYGACRHFT